MKMGNCTQHCRKNPLISTYTCTIPPPTTPVAKQKGHMDNMNKRRIYTYDCDFHDNADKMVTYYPKRDYPEKSLSKKHYKIASKYNQDQLLDVVEKTPTKTPVMGTYCNPANPNIKEIIHRNFTKNHRKTNYWFRRLPNLRGPLTNANTNYQPTSKDTPLHYSPICPRLGKCTYCLLLKIE